MQNQYFLEGLPDCIFQRFGPENGASMSRTLMQNRVRRAHTAQVEKKLIFEGRAQQKEQKKQFRGKKSKRVKP